MDLIRQGGDEEVVDVIESKCDLVEEHIQESSTKLQKEENIALLIKNERSHDEQNGLNDVEDFKKNPKTAKRRKFCKDFEDKVNFYLIVIILIEII